MYDPKFVKGRPSYFCATTSPEPVKISVSHMSAHLFGLFDNTAASAAGICRLDRRRLFPARKKRLREGELGSLLRNDGMYDPKFVKARRADGQT
jgi:hypothetical protein